MDPSRSEHPFAEDDEVFRESFPSRLEERDRVIEAALDSLEREGCPVDRFGDRLCLDELIANAIIHGNREDPSKSVTVRAFSGPRAWGFEVTDEGSGFDWQAWEENLETSNALLRPSGRGLAIVIGSGTDIRFLDGGRSVVAVRPRRKD